MDFLAPIQEEEVAKWIKPGTEIHGYRFENLIGFGGFAQVYKTYSLRYQVEFATKVMPVQGVSNNAWDTFINEINILMKLDHPNIIRLYDHFREGKYFFMVLEYCPNGSLQDLVSSPEPIKQENVLRFVKEILNGLAYMHRRNIVHHDIKPSNLLLDPYGHVKITDFGTSLIKAETNNKVGSFAYCAPEMIFKSTYDPAPADVWALGCSVCQILTKTLPIDVNALRGGKVIKLLPYLEMNSFFRMFLSEMIVENPAERASIDQLEVICGQMIESSKSMTDQMKPKKRIGLLSSPSTEKLGNLPRTNSQAIISGVGRLKKNKGKFPQPMMQMPKTFWM